MILRPSAGTARGQEKFTQAVNLKLDPRGQCGNYTHRANGAWPTKASDTNNLFLDRAPIQALGYLQTIALKTQMNTQRNPSLIAKSCVIDPYWFVGFIEGEGTFGI